MSYTIRLKGGPGSGFHGHKGRPGFVGGSSPEGSSASGKSDDTDMGDLANSMLADEDMKKYPGLDPYSIDLIKTGKKATALGIKSFTDRRIVKDIARGAAELINSRTKVGYTVYGSDTSHLSEDGTHDLGSFPMVAYGAETPKQVQGMINYLKGFGYKAMLGPEKYGILVTPPDTKSLEDYWAGQKEFTGKSYVMRLKGGVGSGHHGHKGRPGEQGGSLPADGQASGGKSAAQKRDEKDKRASAPEKWMRDEQTGRKGVSVSDAKNKINRREVRDPNDKPGDLPGIKVNIPNEDGELSRGGVYDAKFRDDNIYEIRDLVSNYNPNSEDNDIHEDDHENALVSIADKLSKLATGNDNAESLLRKYQTANDIRFDKKARDEILYTLSFSFGID
jgi:hypothetical protein